MIPFVFVAGITALSELTPHSEDKPTNFEDSRRPLLTLMCVVMALVVVSTGALSPFQEQNTLSGGDNLVPTDVPSGAVYHGFWPTPVSNASTILYFISLVPQQYSVLTQNQIGSMLAERAAPITIFFQPGTKWRLPMPFWLTRDWKVGALRAYQPYCLRAATHCMQPPRRLGFSCTFRRACRPEQALDTPIS